MYNPSKLISLFEEGDSGGICRLLIFYLFYQFQDTDAQNNIIVEETEDDDYSAPSPISTLPVNVTANTTFLHLHADIPFADDDVEEDDVTKETNESNTNNKGSSIMTGSSLKNQINKNQSAPVGLSGRSFVISRTPIGSTSSTTTTGTTTTTTTEVKIENTTGKDEGNQETSVQVHNSNNEHNNSPTPISNYSFLANEHQSTITTTTIVTTATTAIATATANEHQPSCNVVANQHEHDISLSGRDSSIESLEFAQSVYPLDQYDGDEIFV